MTPIRTITDLLNALDCARAEHLLAASLTAERDAEIAAVQNRFADKIKKHEDSEKAYAKLVQVFAEDHRAELLPKGRKSFFVGTHEVGWEDNGGAVKMTRKLSEKKVVERLLQRGGILKKLFVRQTPSLDKQAIKAKWRQWGRKLSALGVSVKHEEIFFLKLDVTDAAPARTTEPAKIAA